MHATHTRTRARARAGRHAEGLNHTSLLPGLVQSPGRYIQASIHSADARRARAAHYYT